MEKRRKRPNVAEHPFMVFLRCNVFKGCMNNQELWLPALQVLCQVLMRYKTIGPPTPTGAETPAMKLLACQPLHDRVAVVPEGFHFATYICLWKKKKKVAQHDFLLHPVTWLGA